MLHVNRVHAGDIAALSCLIPLAVAWIAASRAAGIPRRSRTELLGLLVVMAGVPVLACYTEAFHPNELLAVAACLGAYATAMRGRVGWTAVLLGFGLATRQWVLVAIAVMGVLHRDRARLIVTVGSLACFGVLTTPFILTDPTNASNALVAKGVVRGGTTAIGLIPMSGQLPYFFSRELPLLATAAACAWLYLRRATLTPEVAVAGLTLAFAIRPVVDPAGLVYYAAPSYCFFVLMVARSWRWSVGSMAGGVLLHFRDWIRHRSFRFSHLDKRPPDIAWSFVATSLLVVPVVVAFIRLRALLSTTDATRATGAPGQTGKPVASADPLPS